MLTTLTGIALAAHHAHPAHWMGQWAGGFGWLFLLIPLFWIAVIVLIVLLVGRRWRRQGPWASPQHPGADAERTLAERFAQGDIDEVEYRARLEVLRANRQDGGRPR
ncbi:MAG: SHOCT domain-containing protein [Microbacteriaceae bacterium]